MKNYYDYTIKKGYDKDVFAKTVELLMNNLKDIEESEYDDDIYDEYQQQKTTKTKKEKWNGKIL